MALINDTVLCIWTATWVSDMATDCTMTSKPGMDCGSKQGLHVPQTICSTTRTIHHHDDGCVWELIWRNTITYRACIERQGVTANGAVRAAAGEYAEGEECWVILARVSKDAWKGETCVCAQSIRFAYVLRQYGWHDLPTLSVDAPSQGSDSKDDCEGDAYHCRRGPYQLEALTSAGIDTCIHTRTRGGDRK